MPDNAPQSFANHTRLDPLFHFFALPVFGINFFLTIWNLFRNFSFTSAWMVVVALAASIAVFKIRTYALKALSAYQVRGRPDPGIDARENRHAARRPTDRHALRLRR